MTTGGDSPTRGLCLDVVLASLLVGGSVAYLAALPRTQVGMDEATYLKEALRILGGEVLYRDIFDLTTPGWMYLMALLFKVFGATFGTARVAAAVIQAATALTVFVTCRSIGVRREIAVALATVCVFSAEFNFPLASQHWLATLLSACILLAYVRLGRSTAGVLVTGLLVGVMISVHQQRGASIASGALLFVTGDALLSGRAGGTSTRVLLVRFLALAAGVAAVVGPMLAWIVWEAGFGPVWRALVQFPLIDYRQSARCRWGFEMVANYLPAIILRWLPIVLVPAVLRLAFLWGRPAYAQQRRALLLILLHCGASILSIWYYPDRIHISFIVPSFAVLIGDLIEAGLQAGPRRATDRGTQESPAPVRMPTHIASITIGYLLSAALILPTLAVARDHYIRRWEKFPYPYYGPFGRIDFPHREAVELHQTVERLLDDVPGRTLFCHLNTSYTCLFAGGHNPTRFELLINYYNSPAQLAEATHALTLKHVPYIMSPPHPDPNDPIGAFIRRNYVQMERGGVLKTVWRRKPDTQQSVD